MPKHLLDDIRTSKNPEIQPERRVDKKDFFEKMEARNREPRPVSNINNSFKSKKKRPRYMLWFVALVSVVFLFFAISFLFSKAEVTVNPKMKDVVLSESLSASKDSDTNGLSFDLVVISGDDNKTIPASGEKDVSIKATGTAIIYNTYSSVAQHLDIDTRLEGSNGKIYKTLTATVVPGMSKGVAGSVQVKIYATEAGDTYNSGPLDFTIFGFKGTPKYSKFYARSQGNISGGFIGKAPVVSDDDKVTAESSLKSDLQTQLLQKANAQIPSGFILFKDAIFLNADDSDVTSVYNADNSTTMTLKGTLYGLLFNEDQLTKKIAADTVDKYDGSDVFIPDITNLNFALADKDNVSFDQVKNIDFTISGPAKIVWKLDQDKFINDLLGKSKSDFNQILSQYPNVDSASLVISPIWKNSIPTEVKNINLIVNYPK